MYLYMLAEDLLVKGLPHVYMSASLYDKLVASKPFPQFLGVLMFFVHSCSVVSAP